VTCGEDVGNPERVSRPETGRPPLGSLDPLVDFDRRETLEGGPLTLATKLSCPVPTLTSLERVRLCARTAADLKGRDILVLDMRGVTRLYDYFVLITGNSRRQIHAITEEIDAALHACGDERLGIEGYEASKWVVQDYGDVVVHVFDADTRDYYSLEELWADATRIDWEQE